jgi:hypothetical protein
MRTPQPHPPPSLLEARPFYLTSIYLISQQDQSKLKDLDPCGGCQQQHGRQDQERQQH